jgi:DNA-binding transcriptional ArsR family regulator
MAYKELTDYDEIGKIAKGLADTRGVRARLIDLLRKANDHEMLVSDLMRECSTIPAYHVQYQTIVHHLRIMAESEIVALTDVPIPASSYEGKLKVQSLVRLKKDVKISVADL